MVISCLNNIIKNKYLLILNNSTYLIFAFFNPIIFYYLPLFIYDNKFNKLKISILSIPILFFHYSFFPLNNLFLILSLTTLAYITALLLSRTLDLEQKIIALKDTSTEYELILLQRNQDIMEKRDNEIVMAKLNERNRIARDIHDSVGHTLSSSILQLGAIQAMNEQQSIQNELSTLKTTLDEGMNSIRNSIHGLYADSFLLKNEVEKIINDFHFIDKLFSYRITNEPNNEIKMTLILILKEGLNNIIRHSNATEVTITFLESTSYYQLIIHDNGTTTAITSNLGIGLSSIEERAIKLKGIFNIQTQNGYRIYVSIPKEVL